MIRVKMRWKVALAIALTVVLSGTVLCLVFGGWQRIAHAWVIYRLESKGAEVESYVEPWIEGGWTLFPYRSYRVYFDDVTPDLKLTARLQRINEISLSGVDLSLDDCRQLGSLKPMYSLTLTRVALPEDGWPYISQAKNITFLSLQDVVLGEQGSAWLAGLPELAVLDVQNATFELPSPVPGPAFPMLREASFTQCNMDSGFVAALAESPVRRLFLWESRFREGDLATLGKLRNVQFIRLWDGPRDSEIATMLEPLKTLLEVDITSASVGDKTCRSLSALPILRDIRLCSKRSTEITDTGLQYLAGMNSLATLVVHGEEITDEGVRHLAACRNLEVLDLAGTRITDEGLQALADLPRLYELVIRSTRISDEALRVLANCKSLRMLDVSKTDITDRGLEYVRDWPELDVLYVTDTRVSDEGIESLKEARPDLVVVRDALHISASKRSRLLSMTELVV